MVLKVVKPKKKIYKISYATLNYIKQIPVMQQETENNNEVETEMTEAEIALANFRKSSNIISDKDATIDLEDDNYSREIKSSGDIEFDKEFGNIQKQLEEKISSDMMDNMVDIVLGNTNTRKVASVTEKNSMSDLKGLTIPIVQESKELTPNEKLLEAVSSINWTLGGR